jgi:predicted transcriptional regulator
LNIFVLEIYLFRLTDLLAKRPSIDDISAKLQVLETEQESLQASLKESYKNETKMKKELEDKHAKEMSEMTEKLKDSTKRFKTGVQAYGC